MTEMMLATRKHGADKGPAFGLVHFSAGAGEALPMAMELAGQIAENTSLSNDIMIQALSRIAEIAPSEGRFPESLCGAIAQTSRDALEVIAAFLEKRSPGFR